MERSLTKGVGEVVQMGTLKKCLFSLAPSEDELFYQAIVQSCPEGHVFQPQEIDAFSTVDEQGGTRWDTTNDQEQAVVAHQWKKSSPLDQSIELIMLTRKA